MLKAVIFDLGGTLMRLGHAEMDFPALERIGFGALYGYLQEHDTPSLPDAAEFSAHLYDMMEESWQYSQRTMRSTRIKEILLDALSRWRLDLDRLDPDEMLRCFHRAVQPYITLYDDTVATLSEFKRRGLKIGLISNTIWTPQMHDLDLERLGILGFFHDRIYSSTTEYAKPHPSIFRRGLAALDASPEEAIFIGDRLVDDVSGAQGVGMMGVLKVIPEREERHDAIVPDARIKSLRELWDIVLTD